MGNPLIREKLENINTMLPKQEDLHNSLELQREILKIQLEIDNTSTKGTIINWNEEKIVANLQQNHLFIKKWKSPLIVPYLVPYQHSLTMNLILRAK